jgi:hypothetical protein
MFKSSASERMTRWKRFRKDISDMPLPGAMVAVNDFWSSCPFTPFYLTPDAPDSWPDPWQLITENYYCDLAKVLGIVYTLHLSVHNDCIEPEIRVYYDTINRHSYHIAYFAQGKYVLNLTEGAVVNKEQINQRLKLKYCYTAEDLKLEQY